ncbi:YceI family protein [Acinetobacter bereziniae]|uniref:YceI family protein n=1 Tax=Acinetobacter bereziniae TaxID=106648 RepID=UPI00300966BD
MNFKSVATKSIALCSCSIFALSTYAATWSLTANSQVGFHIDSLGINIVKGQFQKVQSQLDFDINTPQSASTQFVMDVNSLSISKSSLKNMIMGQDLFYAEKYPTASFKSTSFKPLANHQYLILGQLTLRNVVKPVTFKATIKPHSNDPKLLDFTSSTTIKRSDFGMKKAIGGVGEKVNIQVSGQWKAK